MREWRSYPLALAMVGVLTACGGDSEEGEPLLGGEVSGDFAGKSFTAENGFATIYEDTPLIVIGDGPVHCGTESKNSPPSGTNAAMTVPAFEVGNYTSQFVQLYDNDGDFRGVGSNTGSISLTAVTAESIAGSVEFDYTSDEQEHFSVSGSFEVLLCSP